MPEPIPVILCGKRAEIATSVKALLLPEYEGAYLAILSLAVTYSR